jgi:RNA polymerase sigma factor (sigma-70 family)
MNDTLLTRPSLLLRLRDPRDGKAWQQFVELYASLVYRFVRRRGLQDADAADLTQDVLQAIALVIGQWRYDPIRGTFRGWLYTVTRNQLTRFLHRRQRRLTVGECNAEPELDEQASPESDAEAAWEQEYREQLFRMAADLVRPRFSPTTWQAFWRTANDGASAADVAVDLGLSVGAVYIAKSRVMGRLTEQIQQLQVE